MLDIPGETVIIADVELGSVGVRGTFGRCSNPYLVQLPYFFILLNEPNNGGLFSVPAPPTYASERRGFLFGLPAEFISIDNAGSE
jgi:hypothetical protein